MREKTATGEELEQKRQALINADVNSVSSQIPSCDNESGGAANRLRPTIESATADNEDTKEAPN